jgi:16S rRNA (guanine527-N7)-methyltransferase
VGGKFVAYKGHEAEAEVAEAEAAIKRLGGRLERLERNGRILIFIEKIIKTPDGYPRRTGVPKKRPL